MTFRLQPDQLPVESLLLRDSAREALRGEGIATLGDAIRAYAGDQSLLAACGQEVPNLVSLILRCAAEGGVDWRSYWQEHDLKFDCICVLLPEFEYLDSESRAIPVNREILGLTGRALSEAGYTQLGPLLDAMRTGLPVPVGVGRKKLREYLDMLGLLADRISSEGRIAGYEPETGSGDCRASDLPHFSYADLPAQVASLSIEVLHIGIKSRLLIEAGVRTIGDLVAADRRQLISIPSVGRRSIDPAFAALGSLLESCEGDRIDWANFCSKLGLPLVPASGIESGREFITGLHQTILDFADSLADPMLRDIVKLRLIQRPQDQSTLEEIAARHVPLVSRERVRQKEKKLLRQMAGALVWGEDHGLRVHFHPQFRNWWKRAADEFLDSEDIAVDQFISRLAAVWNAEVDLLIPNLPIVLAIVTGEPQMPLAYRTTLRVNSVLFGLCPEARSIPIRLLRLGKRSAQLEQQGIRTLGDLVELAKQGGASKDVLDHLDILANCLSEGQLCWKRYCAALRLDTFPADFRDDADNFVRTFSASVVSMLERLQPTARAAWIFRERTCVNQAERPTLEQAAIRLGTVGPSVKREETVLLESLNDVLVEREFGALPFWIDESWLSWFARAAEAYRQSEKDYGRFMTELARQLCLDQTAVREAAPALWAILTGYPTGRKRGRRRSALAHDQLHAVIEPMRIRLRGFQRLH